MFVLVDIKIVYVEKIKLECLVEGVKAVKNRDAILGPTVRGISENTQRIFQKKIEYISNRTFQEGKASLKMYFSYRNGRKDGLLPLVNSR